MLFTSLILLLASFNPFFPFFCACREENGDFVGYFRELMSQKENKIRKRDNLNKKTNSIYQRKIFSCKINNPFVYDIEGGDGDGTDEDGVE